MGERTTQDLLNKMTCVLEKTEQSHRSSGSDFNVFSVLNIEHKEIRVCMFLREILQPKGTHGAGALYLKAFVDTVLHQQGFLSSDFDNAMIGVEERIDNDRRIDLLLRIGKRAFPMEVKIYAADQENQCTDYYHYCKSKYDPNTVLYYLTLDKHKPTPSSIGDMKVDETLIPISFEDEIINWLDDIIEYDETKKRPAVYELLKQFRTSILNLTGRNTKEINMQLNEIIKSENDFRAAMAISYGLSSVKSEMMKKCFSYIEGFITERSNGMILPVYSNYKERADSFYSQSSTNWPALVYLLRRQDGAPDRDLALRIEIDHKLYFGVVNWDAKTQKHPKGTDNASIQIYVQNYSGDSWISSRTDWWYFWKYLGLNPEGIDFRKCNNNYASLFNQEQFTKEMDDCCSEVEKLLINWKMLEKKS